MLTSQWRRAAWRGMLASPFLAIAIICYTVMNPSKMEQLWQPFLDSGKISWDGGSIPILTTFYHNAFLDSTWRPFTVIFSPGALGYDPVSWWLSFSFMHNLAPLHAIWIVESYRSANRHSPAYLPTIFTVLGNFIGTGTATPLFYFLCFTFGPTAEDVLREKTNGKVKATPFILPLMLLFYTSGTCMGHLAPSLETRHYFTWTWQFLPLWVGIGNILLTRILPKIATLYFNSEPSSRSKRFLIMVQQDETQLTILAGISGAVWLLMICSTGVDGALDVFRTMPCRPNLFCWNTVIAGLGMNGRGEDAVAAFHDMVEGRPNGDNVKPDGVTFVAVLSACSHSGLVPAGRKLFTDMLPVHGVAPRTEHYGCMADLLCRAGHADEAARLVRTMPGRPNAKVLGSLLLDARAPERQEDGVRLSEWAARRISELDVGDGAAYGLSNVYASLQRWERVEEHRREVSAAVRQGKGPRRKQPGRACYDLASSCTN